MEGFKNTTRMKCFKEGGFVTKKEFTKYEKKEDKVEQAKDMVKDTKLVKSGVRQHESALHKNEPKTELKLKQGGRAKKELGTARKFIKPAAAPSAAVKMKSGGSVTNVYEAKKKSGDKDNITKVKQIVPEKAAAPSAAKDVKNTTAKFCGGKSVNKYSGKDGSYVTTDQKLAALEQQRAREKMKRAMALDPAQQNELIKQSPAAAGLTPPAPAGRPAMAPSAPVADVNGMPMKKGGKAKKC
jgi:hypothetical protein